MPADLQKLSIFHDQLMNWFLENPGATLRQCSEWCGYSIPWLSMIINSDLFQARLREKQAEIDAHIAIDIPSRMRGIAAQALEKIARHMEASEDPEFLVDTADKMLHRLGYAPQKAPAVAVKSAGAVQNNNFFLTSPDTLAASRALMAQVAASLPAPEVVDVLPLTVEGTSSADNLPAPR